MVEKVIIKTKPFSRYLHDMYIIYILTYEGIHLVYCYIYIYIYTHAPGCLNLIIRNFFFLANIYIYIYENKINKQNTKKLLPRLFTALFFLSNNNSRCLLFLIVFF